MAYGFTYTLPTITGSHSDFPVLLREGDFPSAAIDGGVSSILNGGGNLRAYTSDAKTTQLPVEVVSFVAGGTPSAEVWVKIPTAATGNTIYIEADAVETTQPAVTNAYGRNAVWSANYYRSDMSGSPPISAVDGTAGSLSGTVTSDAAGKIGSCVDYGTDRSGELDPGMSIDAGSSLRISAWVKFAGSSDANEDAIVSEWEAFNRNYLLRYDSLNTELDFFTYTTASVGGPFASTNIADGGWHKIDATYDGSIMRLFVDGVASSTTYPQSGLLGEGSNHNRTYIGSYRSSDYFRGSLDEVVIGSAVSADWVSTEYANQSAAGAWGTVGAWADSGGGITGTGAITETVGVVSGIATRGITGSGVITGIVGAVDGSGAVGGTVTGSGAITELVGSIYGTATREITGSGVISEISGTVSGTGVRHITGLGDIVEDVGGMSGTATRAIAGSGTITEGVGSIVGVEVPSNIGGNGRARMGVVTIGRIMN